MSNARKALCALSEESAHNTWVWLSRGELAWPPRLTAGRVRELETPRSRKTGHLRVTGPQLRAPFCTERSGGRSGGSREGRVALILALPRGKARTRQESRNRMCGQTLDAPRRLGWSQALPSGDLGKDKCGYCWSLVVRGGR